MSCVSGGDTLGRVMKKKEAPEGSLVPLRPGTSGLESPGTRLEFGTRKGNLFLSLVPEKEC